MTDVISSPASAAETALHAPHFGDEKPVFSFLLVKLASRCNIKCTYCYWFRDAEVYKKPTILTEDAEDALCDSLQAHIEEFGLESFVIVFHGGEPLLFPKPRFELLQEKLNDVEEKTGCRIERGVCTNGMLITEEWIEIFKRFEISVSISIDGPPEIHDKYRIDLKGRGTHARTMQGLKLLEDADLKPGLITVCNPSTDPEQIVSYVVEELGIKEFDILPPDATHSDNPPDIDGYFIKLFDLWMDKYAEQGVRISTLDAMIQGLIGNFSTADTIGLGPIDTVTFMTDGSLEPLDVLRIAGDGSTISTSNVFDHPLQAMEDNPLWLEAYEASLNPCDKCKACEYLDACGGGHLAQRWSEERRFDNPSVYCENWKNIFGHIWDRISPNLVIDTAGPFAAASETDAGRAH